jgi:hypothetical protein
MAGHVSCPGARGNRLYAWQISREHISRPTCFPPFQPHPEFLLVYDIALERPVVRVLKLNRKQNEGHVDGLCCRDQLSVICDDYQVPGLATRPAKEIISKIALKYGMELTWNGEPWQD